MTLVKGLLIFFTMITQSQAYTGFDICNFGQEKVDSVICQGPTVLKETTVAGDIKVTGPLTAVNVTAGAVEVIGATDLREAKIKGIVHIVGNFTANNVQFQQDVNLESDSVKLYKSRIKGSVTIQASKNNPELIMECGSVIFGSVKFTGKAGTINITDDSIIRGKITNGSMIFVKKKCA